ncbi:MAG: DUF1653 domain-containing protein [Chloroflexi bacterium]|nr:MAG: DUF1653 domain-containing protein [Chloroflexota bacterium]
MTASDQRADDYYRSDPLKAVEVYPADTNVDQNFDVPPIVPGVYRHYKGNFYEVIDVGCHTETHDYFVVYRALYEKAQSPTIWMRPYDMFMQTVEIDGKNISRFEKIQND